MQELTNIFKSFFPPLIIVILLIILLAANRWIFRRIQSSRSGAGTMKRTISFLLVLVGTLAIILSLPIDKSLKGQILSFLGIIIAAGIALSSTTILGNLIAGLMNNSMNRFRSGDLIKLGELQGRVTKKSIFHTEIQLEDSNFVTLPNLYIASNPVKLTRKTNTVISTSVSLGYDVPRSIIEETLKEAALGAELDNPYVYITELGDHSVVYKIHGFLKDSSRFFSAHSLLNGKVMDLLHQKNIEIVSPLFMNQRRVDDKTFIPEIQAKTKPEQPEKAPEDLIFDEAIEAEALENKKDYLKELEEKKEKLKKRLKETEDKQEAASVKSSLEKLENLKERLEKTIQKESEEDKK
jgi:small-conductance mechanosensitive channel